MNLDFYKNRKILITGHTGFKGAWMCKILLEAGAKVVGYSLAPTEEQALYFLSGVDDKVKSYIGDIRSLEMLRTVFKQERPEIVFHMAAQPLVCDAYEDPVYTYEVNVMGTVNILECIRETESVRSFVNVTTDKVYENKEWEWGYRENENLNGFDPYSNSKSCSELVTSSYIKSFYSRRCLAVSTARAGNVIGGGDFSKNRIIPDCVRGAISGSGIRVRNPNSIRPYQHVLEPVCAYLMIAQKQYEDVKYAGNYNVGPDEKDCWRTQQLVKSFCQAWLDNSGKDVKWYSENVDGPHEANYLKLDCAHIKNTLGWNTTWDAESAVCNTVEWYMQWKNKYDIELCMRNQIRRFLGSMSF